MVALAVIVPSTPAAAVNTVFPEFGQPAMCGDLNKSTYTFEDQAQWTGALKSLFEDGYDAWQQDVEKWSGGLLLSKSGQNWTARWDSLDSSKVAETTCLPFIHNITFNSNKWAAYDQGTISMKSAAAHEWGHAWGLGHVGNEDAYPSSANPPTMATCGDWQSTARGSLSNDDEAAITAQNESVGGYATVTANASFEENENSHLEYWRTQQVSGFVASTSGGGVDGSPWYARFLGNGANNAAVFNDTYITWKNGGYLKGRVNYKRHTSSDSGYIKLTFKYQPNIHNGSACGGLTNTASTGGWLSTSKNCTPTSSWNYCTTSVLVASGGADVVVHARVVVYNHMEIYVPGVGWVPQYVRIDRTRTMADGASI